MKKVYLLGAGSSRELEFNSGTYDPTAAPIHRSHSKLGPLSSGFFFYSKVFLDEIKDKNVTHFPPDIKITNEWLRNFILQYYSKKIGVPFQRRFFRRETYH